MRFWLPPKLLNRLRELNARGRTQWWTLARTSPRVAWAAVAAAAALPALVLLAALWFALGLRNGLPTDAEIGRIGDMAQSTTVYDDRDQFAFTLYQEQRIEVPLSSVSPNLLHAMIAIEDQRFYDHGGFDVVRIAAAALANLRHGRIAQGGSTITQQLARQSFLKPDKTLRRKAQELILAGRIERRFDKNRILELYLNKVYFGDGLYGVEAASRGYFGKHATDLTLAEAALLAGLVKSPSSYAPTVNLQRATARRNVVLQAMLETGAIDRAKWEQARASHVALHDNLRPSEPHGDYFKEQVRRELVDRFGWQRVYQGGLRVFSTIDMPTQIAADAAVDESLKALDKKRQAVAAHLLTRKASAGGDGAVATSGDDAEDDTLQAALIALDPKTGHVRAMVGGRDFNGSHFNRAMQAKRQPGSAFKPFVYATALESGYTPASVIDHLDEPIATLQGKWTPEDEHTTTPFLTMRAALRTSSNRAAVRMLQEVGIDKTVEFAKEMGVGDVPSVPSLALGSGEVTLASMTAAYAAFANRGLVPKPLIVRRVEDQDGAVLFRADDSSTAAIKETTAYLMANMLADVINAGTGARARQLGFTLPAAGKTGTTNDFNDAWFVGFTPSLAAGVWVGFDQPHTILPRGFASDVAVPMWAKFMKVATRGDAPEWLQAPPGLTTAEVCRLSGKLAGDGCRDAEVVNEHGNIERRSLAYTEYFAHGTEPTEVCDLHPSKSILAKVLTAFSSGEKPPPPTAEQAGLPPPAVATSASAQLETPAPPEAPKKKRGFWSKVFGIGRDNNSEQDTQKGK